MMCGRPYFNLPSDELFVNYAKGFNHQFYKKCSKEKIELCRRRRSQVINLEMTFCTSPHHLFFPTVCWACFSNVWCQWRWYNWFSRISMRSECNVAWKTRTEVEMGILNVRLRWKRIHISSRNAWNCDSTCRMKTKFCPIFFLMMKTFPFLSLFPRQYIR